MASSSELLLPDAKTHAAIRRENEDGTVCLPDDDAAGPDAEPLNAPTVCDDPALSDHAPHSDQEFHDGTLHLDEDSETGDDRDPESTVLGAGDAALTTVLDDDSIVEEGTTFGDFQVGPLIGRGSMGEVYLARQTGLDRFVALKVLPEHVLHNEALLERFRREARSLAKLDHPHIVRVLGLGEQGVRPFAALEYVDGTSLDTVLDRTGRLSVADSVHIALTCAWALQHAHEHGMIHRDIKPSNILVSRQGQTKVADFGLVKQIDSSMTMTATGAGLGTPDYMAPEQAHDARHASQAADIYSLGAMLYRLLTGRPPFSGETSLELLNAKKSGKFAPARSLNKDVPKRLDLILHKMLTPEPSQRYASCAEAMHDLGGLNCHGESLSFVEDTDPYVAFGPWSKSRVETTPERLPQREPKKTASTEVRSEPDSPKAAAPNWYVSHRNKLGKPVLSEMRPDELILALERKLLPVSAQVRRGPHEPFRALTHFPEFHPVLKRLGIRIPPSQAARKKQAARKAKKRRNRRKERIDLMLRIAVALCAAYGLIRGITDIVGAFSPDEPQPEINKPMDILDHL